MFHTFYGSLRMHSGQNATELTSLTPEGGARLIALAVGPLVDISA